MADTPLPPAEAMAQLQRTTEAYVRASKNCRRLVAMLKRFVRGDAPQAADFRAAEKLIAELEKK